MASTQVVGTSVNTNNSPFSGLHYKPGRSLKPQHFSYLVKFLVPEKGKKSILYVNPRYVNLYR